MRTPRCGAACDRLDRVKNQARFKVKKKVTFDLKPQICLSTPKKLASLGEVGTWANDDINQCGDGCPSSPTLAGTSRADRHLSQGGKCPPRLAAQTRTIRPRRSCLKKRRPPSICFPAFPFSRPSMISPASLFSPSLIAPAKLVSPDSLFQPASLFSRTPQTPESSTKPATGLDSGLAVSSGATLKGLEECGEACGQLVDHFATIKISSAETAVAKMDNSFAVENNPFKRNNAPQEGKFLPSATASVNGDIVDCSG